MIFYYFSFPNNLCYKTSSLLFMRNPVHYGFCAALYCSSHTINILKLDQEIILSLLRPPGSKLQHIKLKNKVFKSVLYWWPAQLLLGFATLSTIETCIIGFYTTSTDPKRDRWHVLKRLGKSDFVNVYFQQLWVTINCL